MTELIERFELFTTSVIKIYKNIQKIKLTEAEQMGLKANHVMYMHYLGKNQEGLTSKDLGTLCIEDKAAVSRTLGDLINKGLVQSVEDNSGRKYKTKFILTKEGMERKKYLDDAIGIAVKKASSSLNEADRETFYRVLLHITDNLEMISETSLKEA